MGGNVSGMGGARARSKPDLTECRFLGRDPGGRSPSWSPLSEAAEDFDADSVVFSHLPSSA